MDKIKKNILENNKLITSIFGTIGVKGLSLLISLFTTSAYMHYFADDKVLGTWLSLITILNWIINFDLGVGNGLRNKLVQALADNDKVKAKQYVSSGYVILGVVSLIIIVIGNIGFSFVDWNSLLNISQDIINPEILVLVVRILFSGIILQFFLRTIISILYAVQKPALANLITLLSHSLILLFVSFTHIENVSKSLVVLAVIQCIAVNLPMILATLYIFIFK